MGPSGHIGSNPILSAKNERCFMDEPGFEIDEQFLTSETVVRKWSMYKGRTDLTEDEMVKVLLGQDMCASMSTEDHPEFAKLRNQLEAEGYIRTVRNSWNGDRVLKPFYLNGARFMVHERFPSGAAIKFDIDYRKTQ